MKTTTRKLLSFAMAVVLVISCIPVGMVTGFAAEEKLTYEIAEEWSVLGKYCYVTLYAKNIEGLQGGTVVLEYDAAALRLPGTSSTKVTEVVRAAGLDENPYADRMECVAGAATGWSGEEGKAYVSCSFFLEEGRMSSLDVSIPDRGRIPLVKFSFLVQNNAAVGDYTIRIVKAVAEVDEHITTPETADGVLHILSSLPSTVGYWNDGVNAKNQGVGYRYALTAAYPDVEIVNFDVPIGNVGNKPASIHYNAFGASLTGTKLTGLKSLIFSIPIKNLDETADIEEYNYSAFSDLDRLERVIMEFTEAETHDFSRYFTDDGIIYIRDVDDETGAFSDTCKIYYIPQGRTSEDIYLSDKVSGIYGSNQRNALMYLSAEQVESLVFHVTEGVSFDGISQKAYFSQSFNGMQLHALAYAPQSVTDSVVYNYDTAGDLVIPFDFNGYKLSAANSSAGLTQSGDSVVIAAADIMAAAAAALAAGEDSITYQIAATGYEAVFTVSVGLLHTCREDGGVIDPAPKCEEKGVKSFYCTVCKTLMRTEEVAALGHTPDAGNVERQPDCESTGIKRYYCTVCSVLVREEVLDALGHASDAGTVVTEPSCTEKGLKIYKCTRCNVELKQEVLNEKGHSLKEVAVVKSATCKSAGVKHYRCSVCDVELDREYSDSNAHLWEKAFGLTWKCKFCGSTKTSSSKPSSSYVEVIPTPVTTTEPPVTEPPVTEPPVTEPPVTEPPVTEPPVTEPPVTEPPVTEPPVTEPPVTEPPVTEPPVTEPPVTEPPVTEPPVTEPPVTEPPTIEPPLTQPPITTPPTVIFVDNGPTFDNAAITVNGDYIIGVQKKTTVAQLKAMLTNAIYSIVNADGSIPADAELVKTGDKLVGTDKQYTVIISMDVDGNGKVNSSDARLVLRAAAKLDTLDEVKQLAADTNNDTKINSADARTILRAAAGLI